MSGYVYKRPMTNMQALSCELASQVVCRCRCGGVMHGIDHAAFISAQHDLFDVLPTADEDIMMELAGEVINGEVHAGNVVANRYT